MKIRKKSGAVHRDGPLSCQFAEKKGVGKKKVKKKHKNYKKTISKITKV